MKLAPLALLVGAAAALPPSTITMLSPLSSKIRMGGAVINSYCESDLAPGFVRAYSEAGVANGGVVNEIALILNNVPTTCAGNGGMTPCATGPGLDKFPSFVCTFTATDGTGVAVESAKTQGTVTPDVRDGQVWGSEALVKCMMPARDNFDHSVEVSLVYRHNDGDIAIPFKGRSGTNVVHISATASPTKSPTAYPTAFPTAAPTKSPTPEAITVYGCKNEVELNSYYASCSSSSERTP